MDAMRSTVRHELSEAVVSYEEKPRDQWLFDFPAQVALCGTQIWWTTEVVLAFGRLEEGYENALKDYYKKQVSVCFCISVSRHTKNTVIVLYNSRDTQTFSRTELRNSCRGLKEVRILFVQFCFQNRPLAFL